MRKFGSREINKEIKEIEMKDILNLVNTDWVFDLLYLIINEGRSKELCQYNINDVLEKFIEIRIKNINQYKDILNKMESYGALWVVENRIIINKKYDKKIIIYLMRELKRYKKIEYGELDWEDIREYIKNKNMRKIRIKNRYRIPPVKELDEEIKKRINRNRFKKIKEVRVLWGKNENR